MTDARGGNREALRKNVDKLVNSYVETGANGEKVAALLSRPGVTLPLGIVNRLYGTGLDTEARDATARYQAMSIKVLAEDNSMTGTTINGARIKFNLPEDSCVEDVFDALAGWAPARG